MLRTCRLYKKEYRLISTMQRSRRNRDIADTLTNHIELLILIIYFNHLSILIMNIFKYLLFQSFILYFF